MGQFAKIAIEFASDVFDHLYEQGFFEKLFNKIFKRNKQILVLGATGAGKTQFLNSLNKELENIQVTYSSQANQKNFTKIDKIPISFLDTPGQGQKIEVRKREIQNLVRENKYEGIINVVSFGFHEREHTTQKRIFDENNKINFDVIDDYKQMELKMLKEWLPLLEMSNIKWIITLVTKADVWWDFEDDVWNYYWHGDYRKKFDEEFSINHYSKDYYVYPYSSILQSYHGKYKSDNFTNTNRKNLNAHFLEQLTIILGKERNL